MLVEYFISGGKVFEVFALLGENIIPTYVAM